MLNGEYYYPLVTIYRNFIISPIPIYNHDLTFQYVYINRNKLSKDLNKIVDCIAKRNTSSQRTINEDQIGNSSYFNFLLHYGIILRNKIPSSHSTISKRNQHASFILAKDVKKYPKKTFEASKNEIEQINDRGELHNYNLISFEERPNGGLNTYKVINSDFKEILKLLYYLNTKAMKSPMNSFIRKYEEAYGGQTLPLSKVLNPLSGLKYLDMREKLYDNLFKEKGTPILSLSINQKIASFLINLFQEGQNKNVVSISKREIEDLVGNVRPTLSPTMSLHVNIIGNYEKINIKGFSGPSAISMLGRFTYNNSISKLAKELHEYECEKLNKFHVSDIFNVIDTFSYNVCRRPLIRDRNISIYDNIKYRKNTIVPSDLFLSIENNQMFLSAKNQNKPIIPLVTTMHNYQVHNTLPEYSFLCDYANQFFPFNLSFETFGLEQFYSYLPRIEYGKYILSPATWYIHIRQIHYTITSKNIRLYLLKKKVPKFFRVVSGDQELLINSMSDSSLNTFISILKKSKSLKIIESFEEDYNSFSYNCNSKPISSEFIISLKTEKYCGAQIKPIHTNKINESNEPNISGNFNSIFNTYFKLYISESLANGILDDIRQLLMRYPESKFFYIRYNDPEFHLRVRIYSSSKDNLVKINQYFADRFLNLELSKISIEPHVPELNKYTSLKQDVVVDLFCIDSEFNLRFLGKNPSDQLCLIYGAYSILEYLTLFGMGEEAVTTFVKLSIDGFWTIFSQYAMKIDSSILNNISFQEYQKTDTNKKVQELINERTHIIKAKYSEIDFSMLSESFISNFIHVSCNRLYEKSDMAFEALTYKAILKIIFLDQSK